MTSPVGAVSRTAGLRVSRWRSVRLGGRVYQWRVGVRTQEWTVGVRYEFAPDAWLITLLCLALIIGRRS